MRNKFIECIGEVKFYDRVVNKFGYITKIEIVPKGSMNDIRFNEDSYVGQIPDNIAGSTVIFNVKSTNPRYAVDVRRLHELDTTALLTVSHSVNVKRLTQIYLLLLARSYQLNSYQMNRLYEKVLYEAADFSLRNEVVNITFNNEPVELECYFNFLDQTLSNEKSSLLYLKDLVRTQDYSVIETYTSRCKKQHPSHVYTIYSLLREFHYHEYAINLVPYLLEIQDFDQPAEIWVDILDSLEAPESFRIKNPLPKDFICNYLLKIISSHHIDKKRQEFFEYFIGVAIENDIDLCGELVDAYFKSKISINPEVDLNLLNRYWQKNFSFKRDSDIFGELEAILDYYPRLRGLLIRLILTEQPDLEDNCFKWLKECDLDENSMSKILNEIPNAVECQPEFHLYLIYQKGFETPKPKLNNILEKFRKSLDGFAENISPPFDYFFLKFIIDEILSINSNEELANCIYSTFYANRRNFNAVRSLIRKSELNSFIQSREKALTDFGAKWTEDYEIKFLTSLAGLTPGLDKGVKSETLNKIFERLDPSFETDIIFYLLKRNHADENRKAALKQYVQKKVFSSFNGIVISNLLKADRFEEKDILSDLNRAFYQVYTSSQGLSISEIESHLSLNTLIRHCHGRKYYSKSYFDSDNDVFVLRQTSPPLDFKGGMLCEGRFWRVSERGDKLFWCRGMHCTAPNRSVEFQYEYSKYGLSEFVSAFGFQVTDLLFSTVGGWGNRIKEILPRLQCRECDSVLIPYSFVPNRLGHYSVPLFICPNSTCSEVQSIIRITHCIKCAKLIDSRDAKKCSNGWLICHDAACNGCCDVHSHKTIDHIERGDWLDQFD